MIGCQPNEVVLLILSLAIAMFPLSINLAHSYRYTVHNHHLRFSKQFATSRRCVGFSPKQFMQPCLVPTVLILRSFFFSLLIMGIITILICRRRTQYKTKSRENEQISLERFRPHLLVQR